MSLSRSNRIVLCFTKFGILFCKSKFWFDLEGLVISYELKVMSYGAGRMRGQKLVSHRCTDFLFADYPHNSFLPRRNEEVIDRKA